MKIYKFIKTRLLKGWTFLSYLVLIFILMIYGCKKEKGVYLLNDLKNENPYSVDDIIRFLSSNNDTIEFKCFYRVSELYNSYDYHDYYYTNEMENTRLTTVDSLFEISLSMASHFDRGSSMDLHVHDKSNGGNCRLTAQLTLPIYGEHKYPPDLKDSILIGNHFFYDVVLLQNLLSNWCEEEIEAQAFYYNTTYGLIKVDFADSTSWELIKEETNQIIMN